MGFHKESHLRNPRNERVIVLEGLDFFWDQPELEEIAEMWEKGLSPMYMANHFDRDPDEIFLALLHLARDKRIERRKGGLLLGL